MLAFLQFTIVLDFMILSPLGALLMPTLHITPAQFGLVVSTYAFSAGASGVLAAGFADRFDRKTLLLLFYAGFLTGTLLCGIASSYPLLVLARLITGLFAGVVGSVSLRDHHRRVSAADARTRDGRDPDFVCRQLGAGHPPWAAAVQSLGLECAVSDDRCGRHGSGRAHPRASAPGRRTSEAASGSQPPAPPDPHGLDPPLPAGVCDHRSAECRRLHADALHECLYGTQRGRVARASCRWYTSSPACLLR